MAVILNESNAPFVANPAEHDPVFAIISELVDLSPSYRKSLNQGNLKTIAHFEDLKHLADSLIALNEQGGVRLCLAHFDFQNSCFPYQLAEYFVEKSALGKDIVRVFEEAGIPDQIYGELRSADNRGYYRRRYYLYLAGLAMCVSGAKKFADLSDDVVFRWLSHFYDEEKRTFHRTSLTRDGSYVHVKILKTIAKGIGALLNSRDIINLGVTRRTTSFGIAAVHGVSDHPPPHLENWIELWKKWRGSLPPRSEKPTGALQYLVGYLDQYKDVCSDPLLFLLKRRRTSLLQFYRTVRLASGRSEFSGGHEFSQLKAFSNFVAKALQSRAYEGPLQELVTDEDIRTFKNELRKIGKGKPHFESVNLPLPTRYYKIAREILMEGEAGWPGRHPLCRAKLKGEWRYVPVLPTLYLCTFEIPARIVQYRRLDSGEGDRKTFNGNTKKWMKNESPHAGYWARKAPKFPDRGYAGRTNDPDTVGIYFNTNKHSAAFTVPWQNSAVHKMLYELMVFQAAFNPVGGPVQLEYDGDPEEGANDALPFVFPLFRMPAGQNAIKIAPVTFTQCNRFWLDLMLEIQTRWNATCLPEDRDDFVVMTANGRQAANTRYKSHGMRVAGITILLQHGMPIELVSRLFAGHATILQSLYYAKFRAEYLSKNFDEIKEKARNQEAFSLFAELKNLDYENAKDRVFGNGTETIASAFVAKGSWQRRDLGICPYMGQRCSDGNRDTGKTLVEGGKGNCLLCRHHMSGPEFRNGIWAEEIFLFNKLRKMTERIISLTIEVDEGQLELDAMSRENTQYAAKHDQIERTKNIIDDIIQEQETVAKTYAEAHSLLARYDAVADAKIGSGDGRSTLIAHPKASYDWVGVSDIELAFVMHKNAQIYKSVYDPEAEQAIQRFADEAIMTCGYRPLHMKTRSKEQIAQAAEYTVRRLLTELTSQELMSLQDGSATISELLSEDLQDDIFVKGLALTPFAPQNRKQLSPNHV